MDATVALALTENGVLLDHGQLGHGSAKTLDARTSGRVRYAAYYNERTETSRKIRFESRSTGRFCSAFVALAGEGTRKFKQCRGTPGLERAAATLKLAVAMRSLRTSSL
ncbi:hypothetical protein PF002_g8810 [Phytophthora fragariae]|uniref:Uncharacterized protein n=1 Tax=Phytophthora fragariae TaxID=53985 RepID=A0A6A3ZRM3_9STRA|nr:hypothetical protein PF002_g8810 [Phytophthora fragariae]